MTTLLELSEHMREHLTALNGFHNVVGVAVGDKQVNGELRDQESIQVYVTEKVPAAALATDQLLPAGLGDLAIDVVAVGKIRRRSRYDTHPGYPIIAGGLRSPGRHRVLEGGMAISAGNGQGTLGCFLEEVGDPSGRVYALTNDHVVTKRRNPQSVVGRAAGHPMHGICVGLCSRSIGTVAAHTLDGYGDIGSSLDAAIVQLDEGVTYSPSMHRIGPVFGERHIDSEDVTTVLGARTQVLKSGAFTGTTGGYLIGYDLHAVVGGEVETTTTHPYNIVVEPNPVWAGHDGWRHFLDDGDSGSVCIDLDGNVLALMHSSVNVTHGGRSFGTIWSNVMTWAGGAVSDEGVQLQLAVHDGTRDLVRVAGGGDAVAHASLIETSLQGLTDVGVGREVWRLWGGNSDEILHLVNTNPRVATVWHRSGLPILIQHLIRLAGDPTRRLPTTIDGQPIERCLARFVDELARHASPQLRRDLSDVRDVPDLAGCTYDDVVRRLKAG